jgi:hypothetical protein
MTTPLKFSELREEAVKAADEFRRENMDPGKFRRYVVDELHRVTKDLIPTLIGFTRDNSYQGRGRSAIDYCNGRSGESLLGDRLRKEAEAAVSYWIAKVVSKCNPPKGLDKAVKEAFDQAFRRVAMDAARDSGYVAAREYVRSIRKDLEKEVIDEEDYKARAEALRRALDEPAHADRQNDEDREARDE